MSVNVGSVDRIIRIVIGAALLWFAFTSTSPYAWLGYIGFLPILTAVIGVCPAYSILGIRTCPVKQA